MARSDASNGSAGHTWRAHTAWSELSDRLEALALKLRLHFEQTGSAEVPEALGTLGRAMDGAFEAAGDAVQDEAVRTDVREVGQLLANAVSATLAKVTGDTKELVERKS